MGKVFPFTLATCETVLPEPIVNVLEASGEIGQNQYSGPYLPTDDHLMALVYTEK